MIIRNLLKTICVLLLTLFVGIDPYGQEVRFVGFSENHVENLEFDGIKLKLSDTIVFTRDSIDRDGKSMLRVNVESKEFEINASELLENSKDETLIDVKICFDKRMCYLVFVFNGYHNCSISLYVKKKSGEIETFDNVKVR